MTTPEATPRLRTDSNYSINVNRDLARLRKIEAAARALYDEAAETFPDEWIDAESSMAMQVTARGRTLAALRAALDEESQP